MFCQNCGHKAEGAGKFCPQCGASLGGPVGVKRSGSSTLPKILGIVGGVVLAIVITALLIGRVSPHASPEAAVSSYLTAFLEEFDASQVLELTDPQAFELAGVGMDETRQAIQAFLDYARREIERGASISFEVEGTELQNGRAETAVTIRSSHPRYGDEEDVVTVATVERDGRWYVYAIDGRCVVAWALRR